MPHLLKSCDGQLLVNCEQTHLLRSCTCDSDYCFDFTFTQTVTINEGHSPSELNVVSGSQTYHIGMGHYSGPQWLSGTVGCNPSDLGPYYQACPQPQYAGAAWNDDWTDYSGVLHPRAFVFSFMLMGQGGNWVILTDKACPEGDYPDITWSSDDTTDPTNPSYNPDAPWDNAIGKIEVSVTGISIYKCCDSSCYPRLVSAFTLDSWSSTDRWFNSLSAITVTQDFYKGECVWDYDDGIHFFRLNKIGGHGSWAIDVIPNYLPHAKKPDFIKPFKLGGDSSSSSSSNSSSSSSSNSSSSYSSSSSSSYSSEHKGITLYKVGTSNHCDPTGTYSDGHGTTVVVS